MSCGNNLERQEEEPRQQFGKQHWSPNRHVSWDSISELILRSSLVQTGREAGNTFRLERFNSLTRKVVLVFITSVSCSGLLQRVLHVSSSLSREVKDPTLVSRDGLSSLGIPLSNEHLAVMLFQLLHFTGTFLCKHKYINPTCPTINESPRFFYLLSLSSWAMFVLLLHLYIIFPVETSGFVLVGSPHFPKRALRSLWLNK